MEVRPPAFRALDDDDHDDDNISDEDDDLKPRKSCELDYYYFLAHGEP